MNPDDDLLRRMARRNWIILGVLVLLSLPWLSAKTSLGVAAGGLIAICGHHWRQRALKRMLDWPGQASPGGFQFGYMIRLATLGAAIYLLLVRFELHPLAIAVGLLTVLINVLITTLQRLR